jgi:hypothetical protein
MAMKISTMRSIDFWVGVPLCAGCKHFASHLEALAARIAAPHPPNPLYRIVRNG